MSKAISLEEARKYIYSIDFSNLINKMVNHMGWSEKDVLKICKMYRDFLFLNKKYCHKYKLPPSEEIDEFWHQHILDTKRYRQDCEKVFGEYFDHYPYFGIDEKTNFSDLTSAFTKVQELYKKEFGYEIYNVRTIFFGVASFFRKLRKKLSKIHVN